MNQALGNTLLLPPMAAQAFHLPTQVVNNGAQSDFGIIKSSLAEAPRPIQKIHPGLKSVYRPQCSLSETRQQ